MVLIDKYATNWHLYLNSPINLVHNYKKVPVMLLTRNLLRFDENERNFSIYILKILFTLERLIPKCESSLWFAWKGMATIWVNFYFLFCLQCFCNAFLVINKTLSVSCHKKDTELAFFFKSKQDSYHVFVNIGLGSWIKIFSSRFFYLFIRFEH